ncbi:MAG: endonuclease domain-containing protein [Saprospiraceae bacterium]|nr:endonuclease domain-containing protein [Saprospiraceae bacterium]MCF8250357.1 endonuclease domain-containing protein [Saprospiraceae bacterium]MCF8280406.1 endonuclease domain-containing protein [Bacteroidales bacterium]MCF8312165.1 endonuclease domain-containing protein [Saprospiraceae bacterium]MCF8441871.1 endonuclease domain-containing protein [Saprospiraceae bacterium]
MSENHGYHHYNKALRPYARENRNAPTKAENHLWYQLLNNRQMHGYRFYRQRSVDRFIADFMCKDLWLIIEVDGGYHLEEAVRQKDLARQQRLEELGFTVLRFTNEEVLHDLNMVSKTIGNWVRGREAPPCPPQGG